MTSVTAAAGPQDEEPSGNAGEAAVIALAGRRPHTAADSGAGYRGLATDGSLALRVAAPSVDGPLSLSPPTTDIARTATIVARALLEVVSGWRPASQLVRWTSFSLQQDLERRAPRRPSGVRLQLTRVRLTEPSAGVAEVCAVARDPGRGRVRVLALRMERRADSWGVTRLQAG